MSERLPSDGTPFSGATMGIVAAIGILVFTAIFALLAWSPDLANKDRAGAHPYSSSALGYGGLMRLLEQDGQTVSVSRLAGTRSFADGMLVMTIPTSGFSRTDNFDVELVSEPALYVLPKWRGRIDREKPTWQADTDLLLPFIVRNLLQDFDEDAEIERLSDPASIATPFGPQAPKFEDNMQVIKSDYLEPVISVTDGTLLARIPDSSIYILSDPDVMNTFGLAERENARFALGLMDWLKDYRSQPIIFDATLHGFERSESLLRLIFDAPFLGATLVSFATMLLIGWAAFIRFGPPHKEARNISFGKKALAESSAGLISMSRREGRQAPNYLRLTKRYMLRLFGLPIAMSDEDFARTFDRIAKQKELNSNWTEQAQQLEHPAQGRNDVRDKAAALWRWRKEMSDGD